MSTQGKSSPRAHILVVEDSSVFREMQELLFGQAGFAVAAFESPQAALEHAEKQHFDLVVIDYELPQMNGQQFMHALRKLIPEIAVIFVSGSLSLELAIQLSGEGVAGIFNKPANPKMLLEKVNETLARHAARDTAARVGSGNPLAPGRRGASPFVAAEPAADQPAYIPRFFPGASPTFREFSHRLWKVRDFRSVLLLQGEPGSPFEPLAREIVEVSIFRDGPVMVCAASEFEPRRIIEVLAPSILSHDAGTLIVTGVESFTPAQQKTLQNLITGRDVFLPFARRFRLVLATTARLSDRVDEGTFDETLYYKISTVSLSVPNLREMRSDIPAIAQHIVNSRPAGDAPAGPLTFSPEALEWLEAQEWPGNCDELTQTVLAAVPLASGGQIEVAALGGGPVGAVPAPAQEEGAAEAIEAAAPVASGNSTRPPFPVSSDLAAESAPPRSAPQLAKPAAPAGGTPVRAAAAHSLFRPASPAYEFARRLEECLAIADAT
jgi:DNA-binding NtrC family response regulator